MVWYPKFVGQDGDATDSVSTAGRTDDFADAGSFNFDGAAPAPDATADTTDQDFALVIYNGTAGMASAGADADAFIDEAFTFDGSQTSHTSVAPQLPANSRPCSTKPTTSTATARPTL